MKFITEVTTSNEMLTRFSAAEIDERIRGNLLNSITRTLTSPEVGCQFTILSTEEPFPPNVKHRMEFYLLTSEDVERIKDIFRTGHGTPRDIMRIIERNPTDPK